MEVDAEELYKPAIKCRVYAWQFEQLYLGSIHELGSVQYSVPTLRVGLGGTFNIRFGKEPWKECICVCVPAGIAHEVQPTTSVIAKYWVEKESSHYPYIQKYFSTKDSLLNHQEDTRNIVVLLRRIYLDELSSDEAKKELNSLFCIQGNEASLVDSRILCVSKILRKEPDYNFSIEKLALEVDLSTSRLLHLIKKETGTSYRKYRMWQRLRYAISIFGSTHSLTYAAIEAGFNDSSHFSRCFKAVYGATPSSVHKTLEMYEIKKW